MAWRDRIIERTLRKVLEPGEAGLASARCTVERVAPTVGLDVGARRRRECPVVATDRRLLLLGGGPGVVIEIPWTTVLDLEATAELLSVKTERAMTTLTGGIGKEFIDAVVEAYAVARQRRPPD